MANAQTSAYAMYARSLYNKRRVNRQNDQQPAKKRRIDNSQDNNTSNKRQAPQRQTRNVILTKPVKLIKDTMKKLKTQQAKAAKMANGVGKIKAKAPPAKAAKQNGTVNKSSILPAKKKQISAEDISIASSLDNSEQFQLPKQQKKQAKTQVKATIDSKTRNNKASSLPAKVAKPLKLTAGGGANQRKKVQHVEIIEGEDVEEEFGPVEPLKRPDQLFQRVISPTKMNKFYDKIWEKTHLHVKRNDPTYYSNLMSTEIIDEILRRQHLLFTKNVDLTTYANGKRETLNPEGRALPAIVWDYYLNGCSVRILNPQTFIPNVHYFNANLQEHFGCFVGANSYLTPPGSQGFAPHYDDIEAFILQIEGKKRWRLYKPNSEAAVLTRESSRNFKDSEIGKPFFDEILEAGDLLYFPRGTIHQAEALDSTHSLHLTLSVYQKNAWADLLQAAVPEAINRAIESDVKFREGLPRDIWDHMGVARADVKSLKREAFKKEFQKLVAQAMEYVDLDDAVDQVAKTHVHDMLPPVLEDEELDCTVWEDGERMIDGQVIDRVEIEPDTRIRLIRSRVSRFVEEEGLFRLYYSTENSKEYHQYELQYLELEDALAPAVVQLVKSFPEFVTVEHLKVKGLENKIHLANELWKKGLVLTEQPICQIE